MKFDFGKMLFLAIFMSIFGFGGLIWPIFVFTLIFSSLSSKKQTRTASRKTAKTESVAKAKVIRAQRLVKEYFMTHHELVLEDGVVLKPYNNRFTSVDALYLYKDNDCVATLEEFKKSYPSTYEDLLEQCERFMERPQAEKTVKKEVKVEEKLSSIEQFIETLNGLNIEINNEQVTNGLYEVTAYLKQIDMIEKEFPDSKEKTKKLTQYYLPILVEILESYKQLQNSARNHQEFKKTEERLQKTILLINEALKTITYTLTQEHFMDLSADMKTLETLLKKDGLVSEGSLSALRNQVKNHE